MTKLYLTMPQPGETITEGMIVAWLASPGDEIAEGKPVAELETEKALFEYESPFEGRFIRALHPAEARVKVGEPIAVMEVRQEKAEHYLMLGIAQEAEGEDLGEAPALSPVAADLASVVPSSIVPSSTFGEPVSGPAGGMDDTNDFRMSPLVRRLALSHGLTRDELARLAADNPDGRITKEAILALASTGREETRPEPPAILRARRLEKPIVPHDPKMEYTTLPFSPIRMRIAENMSLSKKNIPHAHTGLTVDVTRLVSFRNEHKVAYEKRVGVGLNYLSLMLPAIVAAIRKHPSVNASFSEDSGKPEIRLFTKINLGVAVGTEYGLIIPVVKDVEAYDFGGFNRDLNDKIVRGMKKKLKALEYFGPTIIFNNFGFFGTSIGVQIIQYPLAATLGMGVIEKRVISHRDGIAVRDVADFFLAFDHRVLDGREAGLFLSELKRQLEGLRLEAGLLD